MATDGEQAAAAAAAAAGEVTPTKAPAEESEASAELLAPSGWTKKLNPTRGGRFDVVFVSPTGEEIKSKRQLTQYLKAHPGGPASSEFIWGTGNSLRRSARVCEKVKATESPESEKPPKRERSSSSKRGEKGKEEVAPETGDHGNSEEAKGTDVEMEADTADEEKKEAENPPEEKKEEPGVDAAEKPEEGEGKTEGLKLPVPSDGSTPVSLNEGDTKPAAPEVAPSRGEKNDVEMNEADTAQEEKKEAENLQEKKADPGVDAAEKPEEGEGKTEGLKLPVPSDGSPVSLNEGDGKPAESEVAPLQDEKNENGQMPQSAVPPAFSEGDKKEEVDSTTNPVTPPPVEVKADAVAAEAAKDAENSAVPEEPSTVNRDNKGQIQPGASTVRCT